MDLPNSPQTRRAVRAAEKAAALADNAVAAARSAIAADPANGRISSCMDELSGSSESDGKSDSDSDSDDEVPWYLRSSLRQGAMRAAAARSANVSFSSVLSPAFSFCSVVSLFLGLRF